MDETAPDLDEALVQYQAVLERFRRTCERVAEVVFRKTLENSLTGSAHTLSPRIGIYVSAYRAYVLHGWDDEIRFLGVR